MGQFGEEVSSDSQTARQLDVVWLSVSQKSKKKSICCILFKVAKAMESTFIPVLQNPGKFWLEGKNDQKFIIQCSNFR